MALTLTIEDITAAQALDVRTPVLRAGLGRETARYPGDDEADSRHYGAFDSNRLVGVVTCIRRPVPGDTEARTALQLRGMAVLTAYQGLGVGAALVQYFLAAAARQGAPVIWCNARVPVIGFYERFGFAVSGPVYEMAHGGPHQLMILRR